MGFGVVGTSIDDPGSLRFAERYGFTEVDRQVEQVRAISMRASLPLTAVPAAGADRPASGTST
jgi:hypothetical protein